MSQAEYLRVQACGKELEVARWTTDAATDRPTGTIILLHEALGSVSYWKDFPAKLQEATNHEILAYSRAGHGESDGPVEARSMEYYERQIEVVLPVLLERFLVEKPVLYGHSEGAAISMLYAARHHDVAALIAECPILVQEPRTVETINMLEATYATGDMSRRLGRYHRDADAVFHCWMQSNRSRLFTDYPMQRYLKQITCPMLVLQGQRDEFGTLAQFEALHAVLPSARHVAFDAGHLLHREQPDLVAAHVNAFLSNTDPACAGPAIHVDDREGK